METSVQREPGGHWLAGQSGNPSGRPKENKRIRDALLRQLEAADRRGHTNLELIAKRVVAMAIKGNMHAVDFVAERVDGKVPQAITGGDGGPLQVSIVRFADVLAGAVIEAVTDMRPVSRDETGVSQLDEGIVCETEVSK